MLKESLNYFYW